MLNIIADALMTATRTETRGNSFMNRDENASFLFREERRRHEDKRKLDAALNRKTW